MFITLDRISELFFGCVAEICNPKPEPENLIKFDEFLEKLSRTAHALSTEFNNVTYLQFL